MKNEQLENLFQEYISAFKQYDLSAVQLCYQLPCSLHTPEKIAYLHNSDSFTQEFKDIFTVLQHAKTENIIATQASYNQSVGTSLDVCIDWAFIDSKNEVFADFTAFYHVIKVEQDLKILSVVSHDLSNSIALPFKLAIIN